MLGNKLGKGTGMGEGEGVVTTLNTAVKYSDWLNLN